MNTAATSLKSFVPAILLSLSVTLAACQQGEFDTNEGVDAAAQNEELAHQYIEAYNAQDLEALAETLADPITVNGEEEPRDAFLNLVQGYWASFPDITLAATHVVGAEDHVTIRMEFTATGEGEFLGYDIDGREVQSTEIILFGVSDGQLAEYWYNWDELSFWEQLGVLDRP